MTKTFRTFHPMACRCRACSGTQQANLGAPRRRRTLHPIAKITLACVAGWAVLGATLFWGLA